MCQAVARGAMKYFVETTDPSREKQEGSVCDEESENIILKLCLTERDTVAHALQASTFRITRIL